MNVLKTNLVTFIYVSIIAFLFSFYIFFRTDAGVSVFSFLLPKTEQAELKIQYCVSKNETSKKITCLRELAPILFSNFGVSESMRALEDHVRNVGETFFCHETAHIFGEALYKHNNGDALKTMGMCSSVCHNGCQHAVMAKILGDESENGMLEEFLSDSDKIISYCAKNNTDQVGFDLCIHGLGHSFMVVRDGDLIEALKDCDRLRLAGTARGQCWSGVFMENTTNLMGGGRREKYISKTDPLFPCTMKGLDKKYKDICYHQAGLPRNQAFEICRTAETEWKQSCFEGAGLLMAASVAGFPNLIVEYCNRAVGEEIISCLRGGMFYLPYGENEERNKFCGFVSNEHREAIGCQQDTIE